MLSSFWHWYVIVITVFTVIASFWLLRWTKGISNRDEKEGTGTTGHVWDEDLVELNNPLPKWWLQLFYGTIVFALVYLALYPGLGNVKGVFDWTQEGQYLEEMQQARLAQDKVFARYKDMDSEALIADADANATGQRLFANDCAMCHGSDGRGARGFPNLTDDDWLYGGNFETIMQTLANGRQGAMPVMVGGLDDAAISDLITYVQSLSGMKADPGKAAAGKVHYDMLCVACHGMTGEGNQALGSPRLNDNIWLYGGDTATMYETLTKGRNGNMPKFDHLSEDRRRLLAAYVKSLSG